MAAFGFLTARTGLCLEGICRFEWPKKNRPFVGSGLFNCERFLGFVALGLFSCSFALFFACLILLSHFVTFVLGQSGSDGRQFLMAAVANCCIRWCDCFFFRFHRDVVLNGHVFGRIGELQGRVCCVFSWVWRVGCTLWFFVARWVSLSESHVSH